MLQHWLPIPTAHGVRPEDNLKYRSRTRGCFKSSEEIGHQSVFRHYQKTIWTEWWKRNRMSQLRRLNAFPLEHQSNLIKGVSFLLGLQHHWHHSEVRCLLWKAYRRIIANWQTSHRDHLCLRASKIFRSWHCLNCRKNWTYCLIKNCSCC